MRLLLAANNQATRQKRNNKKSGIVQKAPLLIRSGKYLKCVREGVVLRQYYLIMWMSDVWRWKPGELVFCEVALHFVSDALHMTPGCSW